MFMCTIFVHIRPLGLQEKLQISMASECSHLLRFPAKSERAHLNVFMCPILVLIRPLGFRGKLQIKYGFCMCSYLLKFSYEL